jgi:hypothetical protein
MDENQKRIYVVSNKYWYAYDGKVIDFVSEFQKILASIPPEYQGTAEINTCEETFDVYYDRLRTAEDDEADRIAEAEIERGEREYYERLKRKYGV